MSRVEFPQTSIPVVGSDNEPSNPSILPQKGANATDFAKMATELGSAPSLVQSNLSPKTVSILQNTYFFSQEEAEQITAFADGVRKLDYNAQVNINPGFLTKLKSLCAKILNFFGNQSMVHRLQQEGMDVFKELKNHLLQPGNKDFISIYIDANNNNPDALKGLALVLGIPKDLATPAGLTAYMESLSPVAITAPTTHDTVVAESEIFTQLNAELGKITQQVNKGEVPAWKQFWEKFPEAFPWDKFIDGDINLDLFNNYMATIGGLHKNLRTPPINNEIPSTLATRLTADGLESVPTQGVGNCAFDAALLSLFCQNGLYTVPQGQDASSYNLAFNLYLESIVKDFRGKVAEEARDLGFSPTVVSNIGKLNQFAEDDVFGPIAKTLQKTIIFYDNAGNKQCYLSNGDLSFAPEDMEDSDALSVCYNGHSHYVALKKLDS